MSLSKPCPPLSSMPWFVKQQIVIQADLSTRMSLRRCSKEFHKLSETSRIQYHGICLEMRKKSIKLKLSKRSLPLSHYHMVMKQEEQDVLWVEYQDHDDYCLVQKEASNKVVVWGDHLKLAVDELMMIIKNPRAQIESLLIFPSWSDEPKSYDQRDLMSMLTDEFSLLPKGSLKVEDFEVGHALYPNDMKKLLEPLKPGYLKTLLLAAEHGPTPIRLNEVMELEQWKQVEDLTVWDWEDAPVQRLVGFREVQVEGLHDVLSVEDLNALIQGILRYHETFKRFSIHFGYMADVPIPPQLLQQINNATGDEEKVKFVKIPKTNFSLKIYLSSSSPIPCDDILVIEKTVSES